MCGDCNQSITGPPGCEDALNCSMPGIAGVLIETRYRIESVELCETALYWRNRFLRAGGLESIRFGLG